MNPDLPYIVGFSKILEIGPVKFSQIISLFGSAAEAWRAPLAEFTPLNLGEKVLMGLQKVRGETDVERELKKCEKLGLTLLTIEDGRYPHLLKEIYDPPFLLYVRGELRAEDEVALAVVGSRRMSSYGYAVIESFVPELSLSGLTVVSGLAFGVDAAAHRAVVENRGRAIAVLASGVDKITPAGNARLGEKIIKEGLGAVVSEFPLGVEPQPFSFPRRNRIIAGLSLGVLVIEAAEKSGSLITVRAALEAGRDIFAVPASVFNPVGRGTNNLIKEGAKMVTKPLDVLEELKVGPMLAAAGAKSQYPLTAAEEKILAFFVGEEIPVDDLVRAANLPVSAVNSALTLLEIKGMVKNVGRGYYRKV